MHITTRVYSRRVLTSEGVGGVPSVQMLLFGCHSLDEEKQQFKQNKVAEGR